MTLNSQELKDLKRELETLKQDFYNRTQSIDARIKALALENEALKAAEFKASASIALNQAESKAPPKNMDGAMSVSPTTSKSVEATSPSADPHLKQDPSQDLQHVAAKRSESWFSTVFFELVQSFLGPISGLFSKSMGIYQHYRDQGKAPVFLMTVAGIIALVMGFGYLLQYSLNEYLGPASKMAMAYLISGGVLWLGQWVHRRHGEMADYGSAILGAGVICCYLCGYFLGPYYQLVSSGLGFLVLVATTALSFYLAQRYETKVVAITTLVGGGMAPLLWSQGQSLEVYYGYLLVLAASSLRLAHLIRWPVLAHLAMLVSIACIELSLDDIGTESALTSVLFISALFHGFYYLFLFYAVQNIGQKPPFQKLIVLMLSGNLFFFVLIQFQYLLGTEVWGDGQGAGYLGALGVIYAVNAAVLLTVFLWLFKSPLDASDRSHQAKGMAILLNGGVLLAFAIFTLLPEELLGLVWGVEGLLLIYLGFYFSFYSVRVEGYLLSLFAMGLMAFQVLGWALGAMVGLPDLLAFELQQGWYNLAGAVGFVFALIMLYKKFTVETELEQTLSRFFNDALSLLGALFILSTLNIMWPAAMWHGAFLLIFGLLYRSHRDNLIFTEYLALGHYLLMLLPMLSSWLAVGNFHWSEQSLAGQLARVEAFVSLWLIAEFYSRYLPRSRLKPFADAFRQIFYCLIPIALLPTVLRKFDAYFAVSLWLSASAALLLYFRLGYQSLRIEMSLLFYAAFAVTVLACGAAYNGAWDNHAFLALLVGGLTYGMVCCWYGYGYGYGYRVWHGVGIRNKALQIGVEMTEPMKAFYQEIKFIFVQSFYYLSAAIFIVLFLMSGDIALSLLGMMVFFTALILMPITLNPLRSQLKYFHLINQCLMAVMLVKMLLVTSELNHAGNALMLMEPLTAAFALGLLGLVLHHNQSQTRLVRKVWPGHINQLRGCHAALFIVYLSAIDFWFKQSAGPLLSILLVAHGTAVLFQTLNPKYQRMISVAVVIFTIAAFKVVFFDMAGFSILQKIIALMGIGMLLLGAAYFYQRMKNTSSSAEL
ncbi:MAG: hypothetical protein COB51_10025 [Moraxellaceae bacterium]|nr:MAG: hypothetical protein COB51_10025 [Moraxellaceae bacterium]